MSPVVKNTKVDNNTKMESRSVDFNKLNYQEGIINAYVINHNDNDKSVWESDFSTDIKAQKMKFSIKDFFSKYDQIRSFLQTWSHLLKKSLIFCAVY